jgi:hypothetical protein
MKIVELVENLPDDIILHIYTKCLKRYRMYNGTLIKLIDFDKYKFLEKYIYRKIKALTQLNYGNGNDSDSDSDSDNDNEKKYNIQYQLPNLIDINRKDSHIDDDMICITFTINDSSLKYEVDRFRLKKIEDITIRSRPPNMYYKGNYKDYDWEVLHYTYHI